MRNKVSKGKFFVGVTGGIGSGKSLACKYFEELGCRIFYADEIARSMYLTSRNLRNALVKKFGTKILDGRKNISFDSLRKIVFSSDKNQKRVNRIVHPFVIAEIIRLAMNVKSKIILVEAALIFESGFDRFLDFTVLISSTVKNRMERVKKRKKLTVKQIRSIIKLQMPEKEKIRKADFVIKNNSTKKELRSKVQFLYLILSELRQFL